METHTLPFGKFRGQTLDDVPPEYLRFLCMWYNTKVSQHTDKTSEGKRWLYKNHLATVNAARRYVIKNDLCRECFRKLVPVGDARCNGASHADWASRKYHKRCWRHLADTESDTESDSN